MKATMKANRIAQVSLTAIAIFLVSFTNPVQAGSGSKHARGVEMSAAAVRLENYSRELEKSISYSAPALSEDAVTFEAAEAGMRLDEIAATLEANAVYVAPSVNDDVEVQAAFENLDELETRLTGLLAYNAPSAAE